MGLPVVLGLLAAAAFGLAACQPNAPIRDRTTACAAPSGDNGDRCSSYSLEEHQVQGYPSQSFLLGFVEFDDQGKPYIRHQITTLFNRIEFGGPIS